MIDLPRAEPREDTDLVVPSITHWSCRWCEYFAGVKVLFCGAEPEGHTCPLDFSCGCILCPLCALMDEEDAPCPKCGRV